MGAVGGVKPARARGEGARLAGVTWPRRALGVGAKVEGQPEVRVGVALFVWTPLERLRGNCLNGGDECRVGKCE